MLPTIDQGNLVLSTFDFLPELIVCAGIVGLLVLRLFKAFDRLHLGGVALLAALLALGVSLLQWLGGAGLRELAVSLGADSSGELVRWLGERTLTAPESRGAVLLFGGGDGGGLLIFDYFTLYLRIILYAFVILVIWLTVLTGIPDREDSADFYCLLLGATLGMVLMASAAHLLMVFLAIEMASLPSYALAGFLKGRRQSSEAALKYVVYGGGAAGIMLYGISLLAGRFGTGYLPDVTAAVVASFQPTADGLPFDPLVVLGVLFVLVGVGFKLAVVPFHFWCPDVFEGASAEVAAFLSVASKAAALALLARITLMLGGLDPLSGASNAVAGFPFRAVVRYLVPTLAFFAAVTATFGNLAAYRQNNLKRLLAYSTIAHAGYMLMGLCTLTRAGVEAVLFYLVAYLFMNLGAFAVVAFLRNQTGSEELADFRGLVRRSPYMVVTLAVFLLSLLGIPPLIGFAAKFQVFAVLYNDAQRYSRIGDAGLASTLLGLLVVGGLNTVLSAFYYLRVMKVMVLENRAEDLEGVAVTPAYEGRPRVVYAMLLAFAVFALGLVWGPVGDWSEKGVARFRTQPGVDVVQTAAPTPIMINGGPRRGGPQAK